MAMFIYPTAQEPQTFTVDKSFDLPTQAIEHGQGLDRNPNYNPAVPEPGAYALIFGVLLVGFAIVRRFKQRES